MLFQNYFKLIIEMYDMTYYKPTIILLIQISSGPL